MLDFQQKRKIRSFAYNKFTLIALFILVLIFLHSTWVIYQKEQESQRLKNISEQHLEELKYRNTDLEARMERLQTDSGIEEEIRSKFTVAKEGENMVVVVDDQNAATTSPQPVGFWQKLKAIFSW